MACEICDDGEGNCAYPYYGVAPHRHEDLKSGPFYFGFITVTLPPEEWPPNFVVDPENDGAGTYTHCLVCGAPND